MVNQRQLNNGRQGSGSGLDADTTDGKQASQIGSTPDGTTIIKNGSGELEVNQPKTVIIGDFDNGLGDWSSSGQFGRTNNNPYEGSYSAYVDSGSVASKTVDLTNVTTLKLAYLFATNTPSITVRFEGTQIFSDAPGSADTWYISEIDVSSYSGSGTLEVDGGASGDDRMKFDVVKLVKENKEFNGAGQ